jgi:hypothetical protein
MFNAQLPDTDGDAVFIGIVRDGEIETLTTVPTPTVVSIEHTDQ